MTYKTTVTPTETSPVVPRTKATMPETAVRDQIQSRVATAVNAAVLAKWPRRDGAFVISSNIARDDVLEFRIEDCDPASPARQKPFFLDMFKPGSEMWDSIIEEMKKLRSGDGEYYFRHLGGRSFLDLDTICLLRLTA